jgi:hypothetical protein
MLVVKIMIMILMKPELLCCALDVMIHCAGQRDMLIELIDFKSVHRL